MSPQGESNGQAVGVLQAALFRARAGERLRASRWHAAARLAPLHVAGLLVAWSLKRGYSRAGADQLGWILAPTCRLAGFLSGIAFEREGGTGWISRSHRMIVGPPCAGVNFLIIVFTMLCFSFVHRFRTGLARSGWLACSLGLAYLLTLTTNSLRLILAIHLRALDIYGAAVTPGRVHGMEGILVYTLSLILAYNLVERALDLGRRVPHERRAGSILVPLAWYLIVALGIPLADRAYLDDPVRFVEHAGFVALTCAALALAGLWLGSLCRRAQETGGSRC